MHHSSSSVGFSTTHNHPPHRPPNPSTGSGKTAAFCIPMFERMVQNEEDRAQSSNFVGALGQSGPQAVVISPTRELALQTFKVCKSLGKFCSSKICLIVGGESMRT